MQDVTRVALWQRARLVHFVNAERATGSERVNKDMANEKSANAQLRVVQTHLRKSSSRARSWACIVATVRCQVIFLGAIVSGGKEGKEGGG